MRNKITFALKNEVDTLSLAAKLALLCKNKVIIYLYGSCGIGKTTFSRGFLNGLGYQGYVKSPTYTFIEKYIVSKKIVYHIDLYRLNNAEELELIGIIDYFSQKNLFLIEWPQIGKNFLPKPDLVLHFKNVNSRVVSINSISNIGIHLLNSISF